MRGLCLVVSASGALICAAVPSALAAPAPIGGAAVVVNDVRGETQGRQARLSQGDSVFRDQIVRTAAESMARLVFRDDANMTIGPSSRAKLDSFVYRGDGTARTAVVQATAGAFRFFSGRSPSQAYRVTTPQAVIGVRGTTYDLQVGARRTLVVLQEGAVRVCLRSGAQCRELTRPGESLVVTRDEIAGPISPANKPWDFGDLCAGRAASMCAAPTRFAELPPARERSRARPTRQRAEAPPPRAPRPQRPRPTRVVEYYEDAPAPISPAVIPLIAGLGLGLSHEWRPRPGPGWRPPGAKPPRESGRRPVGDSKRPHSPRLGHFR